MIVLARRVAKNPLAVAGGVIVGLLFLVALGAPLLAPYDVAAIDAKQVLSPPSWEHPLGTDGLGRDVYDHTVEFYSNPFIIPMEILLVGAVIYHLLNGLRVVAVNFSANGPSQEKRYFWWVLGASVLLTIPSALVIFINEF